jgi:hypothetical protein
MTPKKEQIQLNLEDLNLETIHKVIKYLNVKWKDSETGEKRVPTVEEISAVAQHCMEEAFKSEEKTFSMGGFEADVIDGVVEIKFVLTKASPLSKLFG